MIKPQFITFTGIDQRTDPDRVKDISSRYPVEWGILFSKRNQGVVQRYPSMIEVGRFIDGIDSSVKLSAHICGNYSNQVMTARDVADPIPWELTDLSADISGLFQRTQINVADGETLVDGKDIRPDLAANWAEAIGADRAIIQCRGNFPDDTRVDWLYDRSGGAGIEPETWNAGADHSQAFVGYAGGIGSENVCRILEAIGKAHFPGKKFWIDMEGQIRTDGWLDLEKCEAVLKAVYG